MLDAFRRTYPGHELEKEATKQIAFVYREAGELSHAAAEYERVAAEADEPELRAEALLLAGRSVRAIEGVDRALAVYSRYVEQFPKPVETAVETRFKIAEIFKATQRRPRATTSSSSRSFASTPRRAASERDRTRNLAARSALVLAEDALRALSAREARCSRSSAACRTSGAAMDAAIKAFGDLVDYEVGDVTAAATFYMAEIYSNFSRSLVESERPADLDAARTCRSTRTRSRTRLSRSRRRPSRSTRRTSS